MMTCPGSGQPANDDAKFCDGCRQGRSKSVEGGPKPALTPLAVGTELKGGYRISELLGQNSDENRYRAERVRGDVTERFQLRERLAPESADPEEAAAEIQPESNVEAPAAGDPKVE